VVSNGNMTYNPTFFNYSLTADQTRTLGEYTVVPLCAGNTTGFSTYTYLITYTGYELTQPKTILTLGLLTLFVFLFIVCLGVIARLPSSNNYDDEGTLLSINQLKYLRPILYVFAYLLLVAIIFMGSNVALGYLETTLIGDVLFVIYQIMFRLAPLMVTLWFLYLLYSIFQDKKMKKYLQRGAFQ
jgi:hypothetical protein